VYATLEFNQHVMCQVSSKRVTQVSSSGCVPSVAKLPVFCESITAPWSLQVCPTVWCLHM
jgi:hypothetical protein